MRFSHVTEALLALTIHPSLVYGWGALGHTTVAYIASSLVAPSTQIYFQTLLNNNTDAYLAGVATWADSFRYTSAGRWSAPLHFIDAEDNPPVSCGVVYSRDCPIKGCVIGAIGNYTRRILDNEVSHYEKYIAAKFLVHFIGDIHQPLHDENLDIGGNGISVNFTGIPTNLHAIWDTNMPEKLVGSYSYAAAAKWAATLTAAIKTGAYKAETKAWLQGMDLNDPISSALTWASEANAFVCTTVMPQGVNAVRGQELSGAYYTAAVPVIQLQVARAGYR
ncbi:putative nuclease S1 [Coleophoma crateriformis]|uniref:Putative nuclease S1 n=1 Tax=Coleophoma crateriformis TaxID=565419 RepID=A0A3D8S343_9HELO|nr:putative nuclease S1 [Coleophoma crateriformis]